MLTDITQTLLETLQNGELTDIDGLTELETKKFMLFLNGGDIIMLMRSELETKKLDTGLTG